MRRIIYALAFVLSAFASNAQTVLYSENFDGAATWTLNVGYGPNDTDANYWEIDSDEAGVLPPGCGTAGGANKSLHITSTLMPTGGAAYNAGGLCGFGICVNTHQRAESPVISTVGQTNLTLKFDYIHNGEAGSDFGSIWYNPGTGWTTLVSPLTTTVICGGGQGQWTSYSIALPASCENNPNLKIGFGWENDDDGIGTDPSIAINNVEITTPTVGPTPPVADFTASTTTICEGTCIDFTSTGTNAAGATFSWNFGNMLTSTLEDPTGICYATAGTYTVTLTVTDAGGTDTETKTNYIVVNAPVSAGLDNSGTVCNNSTLNVNTLLSGAASGGTWTETTASPSGQFTASTGVFDANGLTPGTYTFNYTVNGTAPCPNDVASFSVTVSPCTGPVAQIDASSLTICQGQSIIFDDNSIGSNIDTWVWSFGGGTPGTANTAGPHSISFNTPGTFNIWLQVTDDNGTDDQTIQITVTPCSAPTAAFAISDNEVCDGDCITYTNNTNTTGATSYLWTFEGGSPASSTSANPGPVCYSTPGVYEVTLLATNSFGFNSYSQSITVLAPPTVDAYLLFSAPDEDTIIDAGASVFYGATVSDGTISWSANPSTQNGNIECTLPDCSEIEVSPIVNTYFTVTTTTNEGCSSSETVYVRVIGPEGGYNVGVPNSFSPNGDGENDVLRVRSFEDKLIADMVFRVYNRYGQLVFETTDQNEGWDGNFKGEPEPSATFAFTVEYTLYDGTTGKINGNVTLVR